MTSLSLTKNQSSLAATIMIAAIMGFVSSSTVRKDRILAIEHEDGSGRKFIFTTGDYEAPHFVTIKYYVEVNDEMEVRVVFIQSSYKNASGETVVRKA